MTAVKTAIVERLHRGVDPLQGFPPNLIKVDLQGWNSEHPYLLRAIEEVGANLILELGVWKGRSVIFMAQELQRRELDAAVIAVDTWLGSREHWVRDHHFPHLGLMHGHPTLYLQFLGNILHTGVQDYVVPLPLDSLNAALVIRHFQIVPGVIHLDGGHEYETVLADLNAWWPVLSPGGVFIGDDYYTDGQWPGVIQAYGDFFGALGFGEIEHQHGKCWIRKPA